MTDNFYETQFRGQIAAIGSIGPIKYIYDSALIFEGLSRSFPWCASKIDWEHLAESSGTIDEDQVTQGESFARFFRQCVSLHNLRGTVQYVGDSATNFALQMDLDTLLQVLPLLIEIPQHHYFFALDFSWCVCLSMEGYMNFGRSASIGSEKVPVKLDAK